MARKRPSLRDRQPETQRTAATTDTLVLGAERVQQQVLELPVTDIMPNRRQPRRTFDPAALDELAASIAQHGVLEPILVRAIALTMVENTPRTYELIAGERRWRASTQAGKTTIPALMLPEATSESTALEVAITENLQRADLSPLEEAYAFQQMQQELGYSYVRIAERLGKSKGYVQNRMQILQYDADLQALISERPQTLKHCEELAKIRDQDARAPIVATVRNEGISFAETKRRVQELLTPPAPYSREYNRDEHHNNGHEATPYSREYNRDEHHNDLAKTRGEALNQGKRTLLQPAALPQAIAAVQQQITVWEALLPALTDEQRQATAEELNTLLQGIERLLWETTASA